MTSFLIEKSWFWNRLYQLNEANASFLVATLLKEHSLSFPKITRDSQIDFHRPRYGARKIADFQEFLIETIRQTVDKRYNLTTSPVTHMFIEVQIWSCWERKIRATFVAWSTVRAKLPICRPFLWKRYDKLWNNDTIWRPLRPHICSLKLTF